MKGELDDAVQKLGLKQTAIVRPTSLIRKNTTKTDEKITVPVIQFLNRLGLFRKMKPMKTELVAQVMITIARQHLSGIFEADAIRRIR